MGLVSDASHVRRAESMPALSSSGLLERAALTWILVNVAFAATEHHNVPTMTDGC